MSVELLALAGLSFGMLLFLISSGLSLVFGLARVINLMHGSFYIVGAYVAIAVVTATGNFLVGIIAGCVAGALLGVLADQLFLARVSDPLGQVLMTFGFALIVGHLALEIWGGVPRRLEPPGFLQGSTAIGDARFSIYRLAIIGLGVALFAALWTVERRTTIGTSIRAVLDDRDMAAATGINVRVMAGSVFAAGAALAALGGTLGVAFLGVYPGADFDILILAFVVVVLGGVGSMLGTFIAAIAIGLLNSYAIAYVPEVALFIVFVPLILVLAFRPTGLFGEAH